MTSGGFFCAKCFMLISVAVWDPWNVPIPRSRHLCVAGCVMWQVVSGVTWMKGVVCRKSCTRWREGAPVTVPGLQEGEESLLDDVEDCGEEECQRQEDEQFVCELPAVVLGDEFPPQLDGPRHGLELLIRFLDCPRGCCFEKENRV